MFLKLHLFPYRLKTSVVGAQKNRLIEKVRAQKNRLFETVLSSTHNIHVCFG